MYDTTAAKFKCVGMSTNCTITLNTNTDDGSTKDDVGMAAKPIANSKSWQVQVDSLNVQDTAAMLTAMKNLTPFTLLWDETLTSDNQTPDDAAYARSGRAFLSDATFTFNDREISSKSLQFTGTGPISEISAPDYEAVSSGSYTRGQFVRLFVSDVSNPAFVIAGAKQLSLHVSMSVEDSTSKDTTGDWVVNEPTALNYDISTTALVQSSETITSSVGAQNLNSLMEFWEDNEILYWQITNVSGDNNRTKGAIIASGQCIIQSLTINAPNRQNATYQASLAGYGIYSVSS